MVVSKLNIVSEKMMVSKLDIVNEKMIVSKLDIVPNVSGVTYPIIPTLFPPTSTTILGVNSPLNNRIFIYL